ncbi:MAG TPA: tetratricopeptide repeat protein [Gemmataceae bacterium]|jgi:CHAT domain-containing protein
MSLFSHPSGWCRHLVVCLLAFGTGVFAASVTAAEPPRPPLNKEQQEKFKEINRLGVEAEKLAREGKLEEAVAATEKGLTLARELFGKEHLNVVIPLQFLAQLHERREDWEAARRARKEALAVQQRLYGKEDWRVTDARLALEDMEQRSRLTAKQRVQRRQAAQLRQRAFGMFRSGKYREALPLTQQALTLSKQVLGEQHPDYAKSLTNLGGLYNEMGDYAKAEPLFQQALAVRKQVLGEKHPDYAQSLNNLALLYQRKGDYAKAEPLHRQSLALRKDLLGEKHPAYATGLNNLGTLYYDMGDYAKAEPLLQQALALRKQVLGEKHPAYATSLNNLAALYWRMRDCAKAEPLFQQVLALRKQVLGEKHPEYISSLNNLATLYHRMDAYAKAEPLYQRALALYKEVLGEKHPASAASLSNLAQLYEDMGDYSKAEPLFQQALALRKELLGEQHPDYAKSLNNLALLHLANKDAQRGVPLAHQAAASARSLLERTAAVQSERQQLAMTTTSRWHLDSYLTLAAAAKTSPEEVYPAVLAWKGAVSARQQHLHLQRQRDQRPEILKLHAELQQATARLAQLSQASPDPKRPDVLRRDLEKVSDDIERLQRDLARLSEPFRQHLRQQRMTPAELRKALPKGAALVDLLEYERYQPPADGKGPSVRERRLTAFVLLPNEPVVQLDLGPADPIRQTVTDWRKHFGLGEAGTAASDRLRRLAWKPLEKQLNGASIVLISPDGVLAKLPWAALPGSKPNTYLLEERAIAILPIPQQLPQLLQRPPAPADDKASLLLVGDVDYGADPGHPGTAVAARSAPRNGRAGPRGTWSPLSETRQEILAVRDSFEQRYADSKVKSLRKGEATEEAVRQQAPRYRYLHFATHGFFAPEPLRSGLAVASRGKDKEADSPSGRQEVSGFHPGLLSGLVLAGANRAATSEGDDGILTALEVGALDLSDAELAVLSACETGLGAEAGGEGLLGLQRAFQVAGARSVVAGLWTVDDRATRSLMVDFYDNLWSKKMSRLEALRQAQLNMLREGIKRGLDLPPDQPPDKQRRLPPFYWAAFVLSGDWR